MLILLMIQRKVAPTGTYNNFNSLFIIQSVGENRMSESGRSGKTSFSRCFIESNTRI